MKRPATIRTVSRLLAALGLLALCPLSAAGQQPGEILKPRWTQKPSGEVIDDAVRRLAPRLTRSGWVQLVCQTADDGALHSCAVASGDMDEGRDKVALALAPYYRLAPARGRWVQLQVFVRPPRDAPPAPPPDDIVGDVEVVEIDGEPALFRPRWLALPTMSDWQRNYPAGALSADGVAEGEMDCIVAKDGRLFRCELVKERPDGFGQVIRTMIRYYRMDTTTLDGLPTAGHRVRIAARYTRERR